MTKKNEKNIEETVDNKPVVEADNGVEPKETKTTTKGKGKGRGKGKGNTDPKGQNETNSINDLFKAKKVGKKALSFNQNKNVADKLSSIAKENEVKTSEALNTILGAIIDLDKGVCTVSIEEERQEKVQNTYKVREDVLEVIKKEATKRNMSVNDYLNKVLEKFLGL